MRPTPRSLCSALVLGTSLTGSCGPLAGQVLDGEPVVLGHTYRIPSAALREDRPVTVVLPSDYDPGRAYPVIYVLDGPLHLVHTAGAAEMLARSDRMPESIVIAVANTNQRNLNMTPPEAGAPVELPSVGRADELRAFFRDELKPWVAARYSTRPLDILVGHSLGGIFALHVLNTEPELFDAYLSFSASFHYDGGRFVASLDDIFERLPDVRGRLYLTMADEGGAMLDGHLRLAGIMEEHAPPTFRWTWKPMPAETHTSLPARATYDGLAWLFEGWNPQHLWTELFDRGGAVLPRIESHFADLSAEVGFEVEVPSEQVRMVTRRLALAGRADTAIPIAETLVEWAPHHFVAHWGLGEALHAGCRLEEARFHYREGIRLAAVEGHPADFMNGLRSTLANVEDEIQEAKCGDRGAMESFMEPPISPHLKGGLLSL